MWSCSKESLWKKRRRSEYRPPLELLVSSRDNENEKLQKPEICGGGVGWSWKNLELGMGQRGKSRKRQRRGKRHRVHHRLRPTRRILHLHPRLYHPLWNHGGKAHALRLPRSQTAGWSSQRRIYAKCPGKERRTTLTMRDAASVWSCRSSSCMSSLSHFPSHIPLFTSIPRLFPLAVWVVLFVVMHLPADSIFHLQSFIDAFLDFDSPPVKSRPLFFPSPASRFCTHIHYPVYYFWLLLRSWEIHMRVCVMRNARLLHEARDHF